MDFGTIIGFAAGVVSIFGIACGWDLLPYFDVPSVGIVFGGCLTTVMMSVPLAKVKKMPSVFLLVFKGRREDVAGTIKQFLGYSDSARREGILSLEAAIELIPDPYTKEGMQLVVDGVDPETVSMIMNSKMEEIANRHEDNRRGWELCRGAAPGWGAMGTVIGLVQMVKGGVEDPNALITGIAVALLTTLYGSLVSTWFVGPVCDRLAERTAAELTHKNVILQGVLALQNGDAPRIMEAKLLAFSSNQERKAA
ncbi:MAG: MotA/TolQ/ExbB proton channel family protein [Planctomycetota bacterium]|jgi:chemotaxis protein MotA|nr:MotA/TolQ/ExbB proton channel family protein [Planctomycetota bacterium]